MALSQMLVSRLILVVPDLTHPFKTVGIALHTAAANVIKIASVADRPVVKTELAADHPATVTRSENQYQVKAHPV
jgi:hypothetical protein